ncbi:MAG TPA: CPBP family intramembrane metalloprotease [Anaerolineae bacterium]|nr:CPBP family intramembrane metalloprotease [Anaerolineae bacterium]
MESFYSLLLFLPFIALVVVANLGERQPWARYTTLGLLILTDVVLLGGGLLFALLGVLQAVDPTAAAVPGLAGSVWGLAAALFGTGIVAVLPLIPAVRRGLARILPIDASSPVHMTALAFAVYEVGLVLGEMALIGDISTLAEAAQALTPWDVLLSGLPLLLLALAGVGLIVRRGGVQTLERLGLRLPQWRHLLLAAVLIAALLALDYGVNAAWEALDPAGYGKLTGVTEQLFGGLMTVGGAIVLGLSAGISEELLFRGALQPRLGLVLSSVLFAAGHLQYGLTVAMLEVFVIGLVLGLVRRRTNTTTAILIHAGYNAAGVLLGLLKP